MEEDTFSNINVVVWRQSERENSSLPVAGRISKRRVSKVPARTGKTQRKHKRKQEGWPKWKRNSTQTQAQAVIRTFQTVWARGPREVIWIQCFLG